MADIDELIERATGLHDRLATVHPSLSRGQVWCLTCGATMSVKASGAMRHGWPKCCGHTMTIDSPEERAALRAHKEQHDGR